MPPAQRCVVMQPETKQGCPCSSLAAARLRSDPGASHHGSAPQPDPGHAGVGSFRQLRALFCLLPSTKHVLSPIHFSPSPYRHPGRWFAGPADGAGAVGPGIVHRPVRPGRPGSRTCRCARGRRDARAPGRIGRDGARRRAHGPVWAAALAAAACTARYAGVFATGWHHGGLAPPGCA